MSDRTSHLALWSTFVKWIVLDRGRLLVGNGGGLFLVPHGLRQEYAARARLATVSAVARRGAGELPVHEIRPRQRRRQQSHHGRLRNHSAADGSAGDVWDAGHASQSGSYRIVDMQACIIQHEANNEMVEAVKEIGRELGISTCNEETDYVSKLKFIKDTQW